MSTVVKTRPVGATASLTRNGQPHVVSVTGGDLQLTTRVAEPGFNPLDLLYASVSACLVLSVRIAASHMGILDGLREVKARVTGEKATEGPSRVERFLIEFEFDSDYDAETRAALIRKAEQICTVSNTLRADPQFVERDLTA